MSQVFQYDHESNRRKTKSRSQILESLSSNGDYQDSIAVYNSIQTSEQSSSIDNKKRIIVSFTSYPARINLVSKVLQSLYFQSEKADKILLWLAEEQFPDRDADLPIELIRDRDAGKFELRWCDDLGSHKKYFYAMQEYPEDIIITVDDDMLYHQDTIKTLCELHRKYPRAVATIYAKLMLFDDNYDLLPYTDWLYNVVLPVASMQVIPMGCSGVLYPPHVLDKGVFDKQMILNKLKYNGVICDDDVWLKIHSMLAETPSVTQAEYTISHEVIPTDFGIGALDTANQQQQNLLANQLSLLKSADGKRSVKDVISKAHKDGDFYDLNSPVVRERTYQFVIEKLNIKVKTAYENAKHVSHGHLHYVLSFFTMAMTYGDTQLSRKYIAELKKSFLSIPDIEELSNKSKFVDALIKYDAVLLDQLNIWHRQLKNYYQMLDNWNNFFQAFPDKKSSYTYTRLYMKFLQNMYRFSKDMNHDIYSDIQIMELKKTVKTQWKKIPFSVRFRYLAKLSANRIRHYLSGINHNR